LLLIFTRITQLLPGVALFKIYLIQQHPAFLSRVLIGVGFASSYWAAIRSGVINGSAGIPDKTIHSFAESVSHPAERDRKSKKNLDRREKGE
jgi:hypothetical protein